MGIFKDLFWDISESRLSEWELYIKLAREKEAKGDWDSAGYHYKHVEEWERAGDAYMQSCKRKQGAYNLSPNFAAQCYYEGRNYSKMREAYLEAFSAGSAGASTGVDAKHDIQKLKQAGELENFMKAILKAYPGPDIPKIDGWYHYEDAIHVSTLFDTLREAKEASHAAELFLHYRKALEHKMDDAIKGLLQSGNGKKALEVCRVLVHEKSLSGGAYHNIIKLFLDVRDHEAARELYVAYFGLEPGPGQLEFAKTALKETGQWKAFLEDTLRQSPLSLGKALSYLVYKYSSSQSEGNGELEADFLLKCYDAVGPKNFDNDKGMTTDWLARLAEFWQKRGDSEKQGEFRLRHVEDKKRIGGEDLLGQHDYIDVASALGDKQDFNRAAEATEKAATMGIKPARESPIGLWHQAAQLYERAGNRAKAAEIYDQLCRKTKADRVRGNLRYDLNEARPLLEGLSLQWDSKKYIVEKSSELSHSQKAKEAATRLLEDAERNGRQGFFSMWEDWLVIPQLYKVAKDQAGYREALQRIEKRFRNRGAWLFAARVYLFEEAYDEFDRLCQEQDELEVAALWYEQANMAERAAKIYDLMGRGGKSGKAQSEGAKQKPQDAAKPKSESAEELEKGTLEQMVCPQCGAEVKPHWTVCPKCDADLQQRNCRHCGEPLEPDWKRCPVCRSALEGAD